jgi:hypothetical protein
VRKRSRIDQLKLVGLTLTASVALGLPAAASADQVGGGPREPTFSGFGNGGQSNGAFVCHFHNPGVGVTNKNGSHGTGFCGE